MTDPIACGNCGHPSPGHWGSCWYEIDGPGPGPKPTNPHDIPCPHGDDVGCCLVCTPGESDIGLARPPQGVRVDRVRTWDDLPGPAPKGDAA